MLTQDRLKELFSYDPSTGNFTRLVDTYRRHFKAGETAGTRHSDGCIVIGVDKKHYKAHRLAFLYMNGKLPEFGVDHRDGNRANNSWLNLREATQLENMQNQKLRKDSRSGVTGVSYDKHRGKWQAKIQSENKGINLGRFPTRELAEAAYRSAKQELHRFNPVPRI